jgi:hypothetical protein
MGTKGSYYIVVARRRDWTLAYPRHIWESMAPEEQAEVVARQQALFDAMQRERSRRKDGRSTRRPRAKRIPHASQDTPCKAPERALEGVLS